MDPLLTNRVDPALLRVMDKRGSEREPLPSRRRPAAPKPSAKEEEQAEPTTHEVDDLA